MSQPSGRGRGNKRCQGQEEGLGGKQGLMKFAATELEWIRQGAPGWLRVCDS